MYASSQPTRDLYTYYFIQYVVKILYRIYMILPPSGFDVK